MHDAKKVGYCTEIQRLVDDDTSTKILNTPLTVQRDNVIWRLEKNEIYSVSRYFVYRL
jgi:hypothetical protein